MSEDYQAVARRFRPQLFCDIVGQPVIVQTLVNALKYKQVSHAYLFSGSKGTGKTSTARVFAKALICPYKNENQEPCNACTFCKEINSGTSLNLIEIDGASNRGIDDIRKINESVAYPPPQGSKRIFLIDEVHMLTKEAFNALLKTLEEPPPHTKFIFATTEVHKLPPTILSRCQKFYFLRHSHRNIQEKLREIASRLNLSIDDEALALLAQLSEGSLRDAEGLLDQASSFTDKPLNAALIRNMLGHPPQEEVLRMATYLQEGKVEALLDLSESIFQEGRSYSRFLTSLMEHYHSKLHQIARKKESTLLLPSYHHALKELSLMQQQISETTHERIFFEQGLFKVLDIFNGLSLEKVIEKLLTLEKQLQTSPQPSPSLPPSKATAPSSSGPKKSSFKSQAASEEEWEDLHRPAIEKKKPSSERGPITLSTKENHKIDTLLQFSGIELKGNIKKHKIKISNEEP